MIGALIAALCVGLVVGAIIAGPWWFAAGYADCAQRINSLTLGGVDDAV